MKEVDKKGGYSEKEEERGSEKVEEEEARVRKELEGRKWETAEKMYEVEKNHEGKIIEEENVFVRRKRAEGKRRKIQCEEGTAALVRIKRKKRRKRGLRRERIAGKGRMGREWTARPKEEGEGYRGRRGRRPK